MAVAKRRGGGLSEFRLIELFLAAFARGCGRVVVGPGDDCAVLRPARGEECITTDAVVEGVHFSFPEFSLEEVGHKALAVNLSDLAAMGARPSWFVCAIGWPERRLDVRPLARGMARLAKRHGMELVGGNFTSSPVLSVTITAAGEVGAGRALLRSGAGAGDRLYVSGTLGDARLGLKRPEVKALATRQRRPTPRVELGLCAARFASAAIDVSDGLAQDLGHLCRASNVGATVEVERLPLSPAMVRVVGGKSGRSAAWNDALAGGEDYELCLAVPEKQGAAFERACAHFGETVTRIGRFNADARLRFVDGLGKQVRPGEGFDHFR